MKSQSLFADKSKKSVVNLSFDEVTLKVVKVKKLHSLLIINVINVNFCKIPTTLLKLLNIQQTYKVQIWAQLFKASLA